MQENKKNVLDKFCGYVKILIPNNKEEKHEKTFKTH